MKLKNKIDIIRQEMIKETPEIDLKLVLSMANIELKPNLNTNKTHIFKLKYLTTAFACLFVVFIVAIGFLIGNLSTKDANQSIDLPNNDEAVPIAGYQKLYCLGAVNIVTILNQNQDLYTFNEEQSLLINDEIDYFNRYLYSIELLIGSNSKLKYQLLSSDNNDYDQLIKFESKDSLNNSVVFDIYFQEVLTNNGFEIDFLVKHNNKSYYLEGIKSSYDLTLTSKITDMSSIVLSTSSFNKFNIEIRNQNYVISKADLLIRNEDNEIYAQVKTSNTTYTVRKKTNSSSLEISYVTVPLSIPESNQDTSYEYGAITVNIDQELANKYYYSISSNNQIFELVKERIND